MQEKAMKQNQYKQSKSVAFISSDEFENKFKMISQFSNLKAVPIRIE